MTDQPNEPHIQWSEEAKDSIPSVPLSDMLVPNGKGGWTWKVDEANNIHDSTPNPGIAWGKTVK